MDDAFSLPEVTDEPNPAREEEGQPQPVGSGPVFYEIRVKDRLPHRWSQWFDGLTVTHLEGGETILAGPVADQAALHGLLAKVRDMNLTLISVCRK
jgi:hypothetical protein